ncbi:MAG: (d)CMP kinase [Candidatus Wallbacteria bacterium]
MEYTKSIAIDGPAGAGKSTVAKRAAAELNFTYVDSGAIYRTCALYFIEKFGEGAAEAVKNHDLLIKELNSFELDFKISTEVGFGVLLNGTEVGEKIRTQQVSRFVPVVASLIPVREKVNAKLQEFSKDHTVLMDGRDIGTCVLPMSRLKIFLTASAEIRAERRLKELFEKGEKANFEEVLKDVKNRDKMDEERPVAPLKKADDAVLLDTSNMDINGAVKFIVDYARQRFI